MSGLRFDGVYLAPGDGYTSYLRFYPDGEVISVSSTGTPEEVARWFARDREKPAAFTVKDGRIAFEFWIDFSDRGEPAEKGAIRYEGRMEDGKLALRVTSDLSGSDVKEVFGFVAVKLR